MYLITKRSFYGITALFFLLFLFQGKIYSQADFEQTDDENGLVIIEAENFSDQRTANDGSSWDLLNEPAGFSGTGAMQAFHANGTDFTDHKTLSHAQDNAPVLMYTVNFVKDEPVYVWARTSHTDGFDDSVWPGLNGTIAGTADQSLTYLNSEQEITDWHYINHGMDGNRFVMEIPSVGEHTFELYYRETNLFVDQIILTTNADYDPNTAGPSSINENMAYGAFAIFPNPVTGTAKILYSLQETGYVSINIYNSVGQSVKTLVSGNQPTGDYTIDLQTEGLSGGIYFYSISTGKYTRTQKFVIK